MENAHQSNQNICTILFTHFNNSLGEKKTRFAILIDCETVGGLLWRPRCSCKNYKAKWIV